MKTLTQKYRMIVDEPYGCERGQMIIEGETVIGFIEKANNATGVCEVVLFSPTELPMEEGMENIQASVPEWEEIFSKTLNVASPNIQEMWKETCTNDSPELND
jgi:hypothetical protein